MALLFRALTLDDLAPMQLLENAAHSHPWTRQTLASSFGARYFSGSLWLPATLEQPAQLQGYFVADKVLDESTLMNICVTPSAQRQGLGRQLMAHYLRECSERHITQHWLEVRASNKGAQALYLAMGYQEYSLRHDYYPTNKGWEDAVLMAFKVYD